MPWLGVRCWKDKIALALVEDDPGGSRLVEQRREKAPPSDDAGETALWFYRTAGEAMEAWQPEGVAVRVSDSTPEQARAENEGAVLAAAADHDLPTQVLRRASISSPLQVSTTQGAWTIFQRNDPFFGGIIADLKEAAMVSLAASRLT